MEIVFFVLTCRPCHSYFSQYLMCMSTSA